MNNYYEELNITQKARWMALISAIDVIESSCSKYDKDFDTIDIKPSALKKYINNMSARFEKEMYTDKQVEMNKKLFIKKIVKDFACNEKQL